LVLSLVMGSSMVFAEEAILDDGYYFYDLSVWENFMEVKSIFVNAHETTVEVEYDDGTIVSLEEDDIVVLLGWLCDIKYNEELEKYEMSNIILPDNTVYVTAEQLFWPSTFTVAGYKIYENHWGFVEFYIPSM
jgi:hypothetical protein